MFVNRFSVGRSARYYLALGVMSAASIGATTQEAAAADRPNIVVIYADDLGYGDLGCYGHPTIRTPNLDRMASEGMRFTQFYSAACVCTPSRAALLTGRLPIRSGMCHDRHRVLFPDSTGGLPASEVTLAEALKELGYRTACVGKWHLGHLPPYLPTRHGFDGYYGIPYSNDMDRNRELGIFECPLLRDEQEIELPVDQTTLTRRYTQEAVRFIEASQEEPFFLYFPHTFPHIPLFASEEFLDTSARGLYGDVVEELDWSVGQVLETLERLGIAERTLVFFSSDNGPWLTQDLAGGSAGLLRDGKGSTWEGGMREPGIAWWPGTVPAGSVTLELGSTLDLLPTAVALAGGTSPEGVLLDGYDLSPVLRGTGPSPRKVMPFYRGTRLMAWRSGPWKAHFITEPAYGRERTATRRDPPVLYHLEHDPSEQHDVAKQHPDVLARIAEEVAAHEATVEPAPSQLADRSGG